MEEIPHAELAAWFKAYSPALVGAIYPYFSRKGRQGAKDAKRRKRGCSMQDKREISRYAF
jgi:hypothetical protein